MSTKVPVFKVRVNYKSGISEEFEVLTFAIETDRVGAKTYSWTTPTGQVIRPVHFNADAVESVWQVGQRDG